MESLGKTVESYNPKTRYAGNTQVEEKKVIILTGEGILEALTLLGKILFAIGTVITGGGNTGNGTFSSITLSSKTKLGNYLITLISATEFTVEDPDGNMLKQGTVGASYNSPGLNFQLDAGGTAFVLGDTFTIPIETPSTEKYRLSKIANVDGSQYPDCLLGERKDATTEDAIGFAYIKGTFPEKEITLGTGHLLASVRETFEKKSIFLKKTY